MIYLLLRALLRHALRIFFRQIEIDGRSDVPADGPLLLAANHPNTLIDVLLVATALQRRVGAVGKAPLFKHPLLGPVLRFLGGVPVERRQEGPLDDAARARNEAALQACEEAVARGGAVLIFPEGVSQQDEPRLMPLKTGLARIALGAERRAPGRVSVVPVALVYDDPGTFRSRARVRFGQPIAVAPFARLSESEPEPFRAARALTGAVRDALLPDVVHIEHAEHDPLVRDLTKLYGDALAAEAGGPLAASAAIARAVNAFSQTDPARVERVRGQIADYLAALARAGVDDRVVRAHLARPSTPLEDVAFSLGTPVALWGIANHFVFYYLPRLAVRVTGADRVFTSTVKLVSGLVALVACYAVQTWLAWRYVGPMAASIYLVTLPIAGLAALAWVEALNDRRRAARARREHRRLDAAIQQPAERAAPDAGPPPRETSILADLQARRAAIFRALDEARADFLAAQVEPPAQVGGEPPAQVGGEPPAPGERVAPRP